MARSEFVYVAYIKTTPEKLWSALTDPAFIAQYWFGCHCDSDFKPGSSWTLTSPDGQLLDTGEIVAAEPPRRLVIRWTHRHNPELTAEGASLCTMDVEPSGTAVKLTITHAVEFSPSQFITAVSGGWPKVISNLKSVLETGSAVLDHPYTAAA